MRIAAGALKTWLDAGNTVSFRADLYTLTLIDATVYRWTSWERNLVVSGNTFLASIGGAAPLVKRGLYRQKTGLAVDTLDVTLNANGFTIGGKALGLQATQGIFDGARLKVDHLIMPSPGDVSLGPIASWFEGRIASVDPMGPQVVLRVKSELEALNIALPRFMLAPSCGNIVYDTNCGLARASFTIAGTASGTLTTTQVQSTTAGIIAKATGYFNLGVLAFTSGANNGVRRAVTAHTLSGGTAIITLALPLLTAPAASDTFTVYPGCARTTTDCINKFSNIARHRGYPLVPRGETGR